MEISKIFVLIAHWGNFTTDLSSMNVKPFASWPLKHISLHMFPQIYYEGKHGVKELMIYHSFFGGY